MSEQEKGKIVEQMANLPPLKQAMAEGFIHGLAASAKREEAEEDPKAKKEDK